MKKNSWSRNILWFILFGVFACVVAIFFRSTWENLANSDFTTFWLAGKSVVMGYDVYDSESWLYWRSYFGATWEFNNIFIYPLPLRLLLTPLGFLTLPDAYIVWVVAAEFSIMLCVYWLYQRLHDPEKASSLPFLMVGVFMFRPTILALRYGQFSPWLLLFLAGGVLLWEKDKWFLGGFVFAFLALKPSHGALFILFALLWLGIHKLWRGWAGMAAGGSALMVLGWVQDLHWVAKLGQEGNDLVNDFFAYGPNVWGFARLITGGRAVVLVGGIFTVLLLGVAAWYLIRSRGTISPIEFAAVFTPVVLMVTPYIWSYDFPTLLIPLTLIAVNLERRGLPFMAYSFTMIAAALVSYLLAFPASILRFDFLSFLLSLLIFVILIWQIKFPPKEPASSAS